jgi:predicted DNA-binding protein
MLCKPSDAASVTPEPFRRPPCGMGGAGECPRPAPLAVVASYLIPAINSQTGGGDVGLRLQPLANGEATVYALAMKDQISSTVVVSFRLPREFVEDRVDQLAERMQCDRSTVLKAAVAAGIEEGESVADFATSSIGGATLLGMSRALRGREGYERTRQLVQGARRWRRQQQGFSFLDQEVE